MANSRWGLLVKQASGFLEIRSGGRGLIEITREVRSWLNDQSVSAGLLTVYCTHTSASLLIQENAAPDVRSDLEAYFERIAPEDPDRYDHDDEGPDDMPAHLRAALTQVQLTIPVIKGKLALGTWQGIYLFEHRRRSHERRLALHVLGE
jgi:secondary thiamine-phosphate synthase enzyme